jgi:hypothetical protein
MTSPEPVNHITRFEFHSGLSLIWLFLLLLIGQIDWVGRSIIGISWWCIAALMMAAHLILAIRSRKR